MAVKTDVRAARDPFVIGLIVIALVALAWRIAYVIWMQDLPLKSDGVHYSYAALDVADGRGFINPLRTFSDGATVPDATHPPGWTLVLAVVAKLGFRTAFAFQIAAAFVGTATVVMTGLAGRVAFGRRVGLLAAGLACIYPNIWLYERELVSETLGLLGVATMLWLVYRFRAKPRVLRAVALGAVLGITALTRSEMILVALLVVTPVILAAREVALRTRFTWLALAAVTCVLVISPWFFYNTTRFAEPVPLSVGLGATMQSGNCAPTYADGELLGYYNFGCVVFVKDLSQDPSVADGQFRALALEFISQNKRGFVKVAAVRIGRTFAFYAPFQQREYEAERGSTMWVLTAGLWSYWLVLPFGIYGAVVARRRKVPIYPLLAYPVIALAIVIPTIGAVRYRAMSEIPLVILAAVGVDALARAWSRRQQVNTTADDAPDAVAEGAGTDRPGIAGTEPEGVTVA